MLMDILPLMNSRPGSREYRSVTSMRTLQRSGLTMTWTKTTRSHGMNISKQLTVTTLVSISDRKLFKVLILMSKKTPSWDSTSSLLPANPEEFEDATDQFSFKKMLPRDERRFKVADINGDLAAEREEFTAFLHPEEFEHMQEIVVLVSVTWIMGFGF